MRQKALNKGKQEMNRGIIYIMWNELFPELVKIGTCECRSIKIKNQNKHSKGYL